LSETSLSTLFNSIVMVHGSKMPGKPKQPTLKGGTTMPGVTKVARKRPLANKKSTSSADSAESIPFKKAKTGGHINESEKPNWKEFKEKQKKLRESRRSKKNTIYEASISAKKLCEQIRSSNCPKGKKLALINEVYSLLKGNFLQCAKLHDMSRVLQWVIKLGPSDLTKKVFEEIQPGLVDIALSHYGVHLLKTFLSKPKDSNSSEMLKSIRGNVVKLLQNKATAVFVNTLYVKYASKDEKVLMKQDIFGKLLRTSNSIKSLSEVLQDDPSLRKPVLASIKKNLLKIIKPTNVALDIVVDVFYDFLMCSDLEEHSEFLDAVRPHIIDLAKTKTGAKVAAHVIWDSTPKAKKLIIKAVKGDIDNIIRHEHRSNLILTLIDSVDDTVVMRKALIEHIIGNILEVMKSKSGRKIILYLVSHRNTRHFHPQEVAFLSQADSSKHTKKETSLKIKELISQSADPLLQSIVDNPDFWFSVGQIVYVAYEIMEFFSDHPKVLDCYDALINYVINTDTEKDKEPTSSAPDQDLGLQFIFKKLIVKNHKDSSKKQCPEEGCFAIRLSKKVKKNVCLQFLNSNRGCFILLHLLESKHEEIVKHLFKILKEERHLTALNQQSFIASSLLSDSIIKIKELGIDQFCTS